MGDRCGSRVAFVPPRLALAQTEDVEDAEVLQTRRQRQRNSGTKVKVCLVRGLFVARFMRLDFRAVS